MTTGGEVAGVKGNQSCKPGELSEIKSNELNIRLINKDNAKCCWNNEINKHYDATDKRRKK